MSTGDAPITPPVDLGPIGPTARYEFTKEQETTIGDLANKMQFVGLFLLIGSVFAFINVGVFAYRYRAFYADAAIYALFQLLMGYFTLRAAGGFRAVVETVGWDVPHLMSGLKSLRDMYGLIYWVLVMILVAMIVLMIAGTIRG